jgi:RHS repeat-associated protein
MSSSHAGNTMRITAAVVLLVLFVACIPSAVIADVNDEHYLVVLNPPRKGVPDLTDSDIIAIGGRIVSKGSGRVDVTLPAGAVDALRRHGRVKYIQKATVGPPSPPAVSSILRLTPAATSFHPMTQAAAPTWRSGTYLYDTSGNIYAIGVAGDTGSPVQHRYAYDQVSRLTEADTTSAPLSNNESFEYDPYGNITKHVVGSTTTLLSVVSSTNRFTTGSPSPYTYDPVGNLASDAEATYAYDPFSMLQEKDYQNKLPEYYIYTASDERIGVKYGNATDGTTMWSIRDFGGNVLRQYEGHDNQPTMAWRWVEDYIYRDGQLLAAERVAEEGGRRHFHLDHLGSPRLVTAQSNTNNEMSEHDFAPFGMETNPLWQETVGGFDREDPKRFTGHERDYASDGQLQTTRYLDYMHARYYSPGVGRFLSIDPAISASSLRVPQRWNRYAYAMNNPIRLTDPTGKDIVLSGCVKDANSSTCKDQLAAAQSAFGRAWSSVNYKDGVITLKSGVDPRTLGGKFGPSARALGFMANSKDHFSVIADAEKAAQGNGSYTEALKGGGANIYYDPNKLGGGRSLSMGMADIGLGETLAHETGHAIEPYFANIQAINEKYSAVSNTAHDAFPLFLENAWRRMESGKAENDIRMFIFTPGDVNHEGTKLEEIWP